MKDKWYEINPIIRFVLAAMGILVLVKWLNIFELLQYLVLIVLMPLAFIGLWCIVLISGGEIGNNIYQKLVSAKEAFEEEARKRAEQVKEALETQTTETQTETTEESAS
jgi:hypothetical protein